MAAPWGLESCGCCFGVSVCLPWLVAVEDVGSGVFVVAGGLILVEAGAEPGL